MKFPLCISAEWRRLLQAICALLLLSVPVTCVALDGKYLLLYTPIIVGISALFGGGVYLTDSFVMPSDEQILPEYYIEYRLTDANHNDVEDADGIPGKPWYFRKQVDAPVHHFQGNEKPSENNVRGADVFNSDMHLPARYYLVPDKVLPIPRLARIPDIRRKVEPAFRKAFREHDYNQTSIEKYYKPFISVCAGIHDYSKLSRSLYQYCTDSVREKMRDKKRHLFPWQMSYGKVLQIYTKQKVVYLPSFSIWNTAEFKEKGVEAYKLAVIPGEEGEISYDLVPFRGQ